jgi:mannitol/fructose-specific phosphotransferase system IIA component (Ntr-type)
MTRPTFSILVDTEENTNLAIKQLTQIALEQGIITEQELEQMGNKVRPPMQENPAGTSYTAN